MSEPSSPDIVAELDRWLEAGKSHALQEKRYDYDQELVQRARDEIVALRASETRDVALQAADEACVALLEDCTLAESYGIKRCIAAIRMLKTKGMSEERTSDE